MTDGCGGREQAADPAPRLDASDPELHYEEEEEDDSSEEPESSDTSSIFSDDSVYPCYELPARADGGEDLSLYQCCLRNDAALVQEKLERGVSRQEATELDINGRNGLMVACCKGFVDIVPLLRKCPYININHQDNDGNTALMMAAQAGRHHAEPMLLAVRQPTLRLLPRGDITPYVSPPRTPKQTVGEFKGPKRSDPPCPSS
ncbi:photoreceptor ankyrin repeat protein [Struthio camelus]|uniref:photoreceptor ankyrin repeat protein n=1 Tax=Struthio camelus TaxID=8801 RepID=UPI003603DB20